MIRILLLAACITCIAGRVCAQSLIPFEFTSEDDNRLLNENDSVKYYVATGDSANIVGINEDASYYQLLSSSHKVLAEGAYIAEGEKFLQDGKWAEYYENGKLKTTGYYHRNYPIGGWQEFYSNGKLKIAANYALISGDNGELFYCLSGTYQEFFQNGKIKTNGFYLADRVSIKDTIHVEDPVTGITVTKIIPGAGYDPVKTGHWEYYTESGELDKKEDF